MRSSTGQCTPELKFDDSVFNRQTSCQNRQIVSSQRRSPNTWRNLTGRCTPGSRSLSTAAPTATTACPRPQLPVRDLCTQEQSRGSRPSPFALTPDAVLLLNGGNSLDNLSHAVHQACQRRRAASLQGRTARRRP